MIKKFTMETCVDEIRRTEIVAICGDQLVGRVAYQNTSGATAGFCQLFVHNKFRRMGIAAMLIHECMVLARYNMRHTLQLQVRQENEAAKCLYEKIGFGLGWECDNGDLAMTMKVADYFQRKELASVSDR